MATDRLAYSIQELADALGVHHSTIRELISDDKLHAVKVGRQWRIPAVEVTRLLEGHTHH